jgi:tRNA(Arg) A34 adenosine deaminase TadA
MNKTKNLCGAQSVWRRRELTEMPADRSARLSLKTAKSSAKDIIESLHQTTRRRTPKSVAIRNACEKLETFQLDGCVIYTSCEPCPMCLGAIYWARPARVFYAATREDAANIGFDDQFIYEEIEKAFEHRQMRLVNLLRDEGLTVFNNWADKTDKTEY